MGSGHKFPYDTAVFLSLTAETSDATNAFSHLRQVEDSLPGPPVDAPGLGNSAFFLPAEDTDGVPTAYVLASRHIFRIDFQPSDAYPSTPTGSGPEWDGLRNLAQDVIASLAAQPSSSGSANPFELPPTPDVECNVFGVSFAPKAAVTVYSARIGRDAEIELTGSVPDTWTIHGVEGLDLGLTASLPEAHFRLGGGNAAVKLGWDLEATGGLGWDQGVTAQYSSFGSALNALTDYIVYLVEHNAPAIGSLVSLPGSIQDAEIANYSALRGLVEVTGSYGPVGGDASLAVTAGLEHETHTGESTLIFTLKPEVQLPFLSADATVVFKVHEDAQGNPAWVELASQSLVSNGFTFNADLPDILKKLKDAAVGASAYASTNRTSSTQIVLDLRKPGNGPALVRLLDDLTHARLGDLGNAWTDFIRRSTVVSSLDTLFSGNAGLDVGAGAGVKFGLSGSFDAESGELIGENFQLPFSNVSEPWKKPCLMNAAVQEYYAQQAIKNSS